MHTKRNASQSGDEVQVKANNPTSYSLQQNHWYYNI